MTAAEHYRAAERLLHEATTLFQGPDYAEENARKVAAAQAHATLAQVWLAGREYYGGGQWSALTSPRTEG